MKTEEMAKQMVLEMLSQAGAASAKALNRATAKLIKGTEKLGCLDRAGRHREEKMRSPDAGMGQTTQSLWGHHRDTVLYSVID